MFFRGGIVSIQDLICSTMEPPCSQGRLLYLPQRPEGLILENLITPEIIDGKLVSVKLHGLNNCSEEEKEFCVKAIRLELEVISSLEFKLAFLKSRVRETNGLSNLECYGRVIGGFDTWNRAMDHALDMMVTIYDGGPSSTIGYTTVGKLGIHTNRAFIKYWMKDGHGAASAAGHFFHEYLHQSLSLVHKVHSGSAVYTWGYLVRDLGTDVLNGRKLTPIEAAPLEIAAQWT